MPLDPTAVAREVRSFLALEMAARKVLPPVQLLLGSTLLRACYARLHTIYMCVYISISLRLLLCTGFSGERQI